MNRTTIKGDSRIAGRPAIVVLVLAMAVFAGLCSMVAQETQHSQFENAQRQVKLQSWKNDECGTDKANCMAIGRSDATQFLRVQTDGATRIGELQNLGGAVKFGSAFMALASGALLIVIFGTSLTGAEWRRETMKWAVDSNYTRWQVAFRRCTVVALMGVASLLLVIAVLFVAGQVGGNLWPLPGGNPQVLPPVAGALLMIGFYSALVTWLGWLTRDTLATFAYSLLVVAAIAISTPLSRWAPGSGVASLVQVETLTEPEVGYLWIWPEIAFDRNGLAARLIESPPWAVAALLVILSTGVLLWLARRVASSGERLST